MSKPEEPAIQFRFYDDPPPSTDPKRTRKRVLTIALSALVTAGGLLGALYAGSWAYDVRRTNMHRARLKGILVQEPTVYQVTEGLKEKAPLVDVPENDSELKTATERWGGDRQREILEKAGRWAQVRVYAAGDMMYFIYFDEDHIMRDFVFVSV